MAVAGAKRGRVLVLRALGLGDFLTGVPAYRALARAYPEHELVLAAPSALAPLAELVREIDALLPAASLAPLSGPCGPELAVNLHGRGPQSHRVLLALEPRRLIAFRNAAIPASQDGPAFREDEHDVVRWCRLLEASGVPADPDALDLEVADDPPLPPGYAVVHPGAASAARRWPAERFAALACALAREGRRVVVSGSAGERELCARVAALAGLRAGDCLAGALDLRGLAALVAGADLLVCGDTGIGHIATAVRTPSVLLFGPMSPALWGPPASRPIHRVIHRGGRGDPHADVVDARLLAIEVGETLAAIRSLPVAVPTEAPRAAWGAPE